MKVFVGKRGSGKTVAAIEAAYFTDSVLVEPTAPSARVVQAKADEWLAQKYGTQKGSVKVISANELSLLEFRGRNVVIDEFATSITQALNLRPNSIKFVSIDDESYGDDQNVTISKDEYRNLKNASLKLDNIRSHLEVRINSLTINVAGLKHTFFGKDNDDVRVTINNI